MYCSQKNVIVSRGLVINMSGVVVDPSVMYNFNVVIVLIKEFGIYFLPLTLVTVTIASQHHHVTIKCVFPQVLWWANNNEQKPTLG